MTRCYRVQGGRVSPGRSRVRCTRLCPVLFRLWPSRPPIQRAYSALQSHQNPAHLPVIVNCPDRTPFFTNNPCYAYMQPYDCQWALMTALDVQKKLIKWVAKKAENKSWLEQCPSVPRPPGLPRMQHPKLLQFGEDSAHFLLIQV